MGKETGERESAETKATSALDGLSSTGVESIVTDPVQLSIPRGFLYELLLFEVENRVYVTVGLASSGVCVFGR